MDKEEALDPLPLARNLDHSSAWSDVVTCVKAWAELGDADVLAHHYATGYFKRLVTFIPSQMLYYAHLLFIATVGKVAQLANRADWVGWAKHNVNSLAIQFAYHSMEINIYQVGWLSPRLILMTHLALRLMARSALTFNRAMSLIRPCGGYVMGTTPLMHGEMMLASIRATGRLGMRYCQLASASLALKAARNVGAERLKENLLEIVHHLSFLAKDKMDISRFQLAIAWQWIGLDAVSALLHIPVQLTSSVANRIL